MGTNLQLAVPPDPFAEFVDDAVLEHYVVVDVEGGELGGDGVFSCILDIDLGRPHEVAADSAVVEFGAVADVDDGSGVSGDNAIAEVAVLRKGVYREVHVAVVQRAVGELDVVEKALAEGDLVGCGERGVGHRCDGVLKVSPAVPVAMAFSLLPPAA